ncbi:Arginine-glutamic acid dipeptide repeats protein [Armadillidium vulgare]|nr:Arginine-glutamic acid dipeptide repeats protein [Armadillidium vulgare]
MTTFSDKDNSRRDREENSLNSSTMSSGSGNSTSVPPSGAIVPGGPNGPDGTIIEEVMTTVVGKKQPVRGQAFRAPNGEYVSYLCTDDDTLYRPGDAVYIESQRADQPFFICSIQEFRRSKRDNLMVNIKWFYRPSEVPETVYQLLVQDRNTENNNKALAIDGPVIKSRELFISDATDTYPVSVLRGLCRVDHYADIHAVRDFTPDENSFFYILGYNPETRRLASTQGEIRIGPSHQAKLPEFKGELKVHERPEDCMDWEEKRWTPGAAHDTDLIMYLRAARSMAAFAGLCDGGSTMDGCNAASRDDTTISALDILHNSNYDHGKALQTLVKCPVPDGIEKKWAEEDTKRFVKGLRLYGKNFFRIKKELLQHKETRDLVSYYYLWKKTPGAAGHRPHRRHRRQNVLRRIRTPRAPRNTGPSDPLDPSSASEREDDSDDSDSKDRQGYHCRHCYTTSQLNTLCTKKETISSSKDWHHAGKDKQLLCYDCRVHFKRYGDLPIITTPRDPPPASTTPKPVQQVEEDTGIRTRTRAKELSTRHRTSSRRSRGNTPDVSSEDHSNHTTDRNTPDRRTPDRRTPDMRNTRHSASPASKKSNEEKITSKLKRNHPPQDVPSQPNTPVKKKRNGAMDISDLSSDSSSEDDASEVGPSSPGESLKFSAPSSGTSSVPSPIASPAPASCQVSVVSTLSSLSFSDSPASTSATATSVSTVSVKIGGPVSTNIQVSVAGDTFVVTSITTSTTNTTTSVVSGSVGPLKERIVTSTVPQVNIRSTATSSASVNNEATVIISGIKESPPRINAPVSHSLSIVSQQPVSLPSLPLISQQSGSLTPSTLVTTNVTSVGMKNLKPHTITPASLPISAERPAGVPPPVVSTEVCIVSSIANPPLSTSTVVRPFLDGNVLPVRSTSAGINRTVVNVGLPSHAVMSTSGSVISYGPTVATNICTAPGHPQTVHTLSAPIVHTLPITAGPSSKLCTTHSTVGGSTFTSASTPILSPQPVSLSHPVPPPPPAHSVLVPPPAHSSPVLPNVSTHSLSIPISHPLPIPPLAHPFSRKTSSPLHHPRPSSPHLPISSSSALSLASSTTSVSSSLPFSSSAPSTLSHPSHITPHHVPPPAHPSSISSISSHLYPVSLAQPPPAHPSNLPPSHLSNAPHLPQGHSLSSQSPVTAATTLTSSLKATTITIGGSPLVPPVAHASSFPVSHQTNPGIESLPIPIYGSIPPAHSSSVPSRPVGPQRPFSPPHSTPSSTVGNLNLSSSTLTSTPISHPAFSKCSSATLISLPISKASAHQTVAVTALSSTSQGLPIITPSPVNSNINEVSRSLSPKMNPSIISGNIKNEMEPLRYPMVSHLPFPYAKLPTSLESPKLSAAPQSFRIGNIPLLPENSPASSKTSPFIPSTMPTNIVKSEPIKKEYDIPSPLRLDKPKVESGFSPYDSRVEIKPEIKKEIKMEPKLEIKTEVKSEKNDRPEIIAEVKGETKLSIASLTGSYPPPPPLVTSSSGLLGSLTPHVTMPGYPYPYPYSFHPLQSPFIAQRNFQRPPSPSYPSSSSSNSNPRSPPPPILGPSHANLATPPSSIGQTMATQAPPAHLGSPLYAARSVNSQQVPTPLKPSAVGQISISPGLSSRSPVGSSCANSGLRSSPGISQNSIAPLPLLTPPAAHTGPVRPPSVPSAIQPLALQSQPPPPQGSLSTHSHSHSPFSNLQPHPPASHSSRSSPHLSQPQPQPPTTQALPPTVPPSHQGFPQPGGQLSTGGSHEGEIHEDEEDSPAHREPSPEPKIEDSECHRSQSAIFLRHWNRGDFNSCARTDLTFKPVPDSKLARKREERARQAERDKEEKERAQKKAGTPEKRETPKPGGSGEQGHNSSMSVYDRMLPRTPEASALSRMGSLPPSLRPPSLGLPPSMGGGPPPPHSLDPLLHYGGMSGLYSVGARERMELEREREFRERDLSDRFKEEMFKQRSSLEAPPPPPYAVGIPPHLLGAAGRYQTIPHTSIPTGLPPPSFYTSSPASTATLLAVERDRYERLAAATALAASYPRPTLLRPGEPHPHLPPGYSPHAHAAALLGRPYEEQLAHVCSVFFKNEIFLIYFVI